MSYEVELPSGLRGNVRALTVGDISNLTQSNKGDVLGRLFRDTWLETIEPGPYNNLAPKGEPIKDWSRILLGDRTTLLFWLRRVTLGDDFSFRVTCRACRKSFSWVLDLSELEVSGLSQEMSATLERDGLDGYLLLELPGSGRKVGLKCLTGKDQLAIENAVSSGFAFDVVALLARLPYIEGASSPAERRKFVESLHLLDANFLRESWEEHDIFIQDSVEVECPSCLTTSTIAIPVGEDFFSAKSTKTSGSKR